MTLMRCFVITSPRLVGNRFLRKAGAFGKRVGPHFLDCYPCMGSLHIRPSHDKTPPHPTIPESGSSILESLHGRKRREERRISVEDFENAVRYGVRSRSDYDKSGKPCWLFHYDIGRITVITNDSQTEEITSWAHPCWGLNVEKVTITTSMIESHEKTVENSKSHHLWNSHAVAVVDQSGSMRATDTDCGVTRSDLVWLCLAIDYVGKRLQAGEATENDYFSLVLLGPDAKCAIHKHPVNWILYNKIVDMLRARQPLGHGNYLPAISYAKDLLMENNHGGCLLQLVFLTNGAPSDKTPKSYVADGAPSDDTTKSYTTLEYHREKL